MDIEQLTDDTRSRLLHEHPLARNTYDIDTPMLERAQEIIYQHVFMRAPGTYLSAPRRMGKTTCMKLTRKFLEVQFPKAFTGMLSVNGAEKGSTNFYSEIFFNENLIHRASWRSSQYVMQLHQWIETNVLALGGNQFIFLIDEMQLMSVNEFRILQAIHNRLDLHNINMTTIGFAQPSIEVIRSNLELSGASELNARFLCRPVSFSGCSQVQDLHNILDAYDHRLIYPEGSNISYTHFFLPQAFRNGFRLASFDELIWRQLEQVMQNYGIDSLPMEHLTMALKYLINHLSQQDNLHLTLEASTVDWAISKSGLHYYNAQNKST